MKTLPALMLAAAGVGFGHAVMPDHWMPLAVLSRSRRYSTRRVVRLSLAAGAAHVLVSLLLGAILMLVGLQFRDTVAKHTDVAVGGILLVTGVAFLVMEIAGRGPGHSHGVGGHSHGSSGHRQHDHGHEHAHEHGHSHEHEHSHGPDGHARSLAAFLVPFGAAASPDLTILPVFLAAGSLGTGAAIGSLTAFTVATTATIVALATATAAGARLLTAPWTDRCANLLTAGTLLLIGALVATGTI